MQVTYSFCLAVLGNIPIPKRGVLPTLFFLSKETHYDSDEILGIEGTFDRHWILFICGENCNSDSLEMQNVLQILHVFSIF